MNVEGMDDQELFNAAMSDAAPASEPVAQEPAPAEPIAESHEQPRDESGRFAPKAAAEAEAQAATEPAPVEQPKPDAEATVPSWRLRELREEREAAAKRAQDAEERAQRFEAQLRQMQARIEPPKTPDMYAEPEAWQQHLLQQQQDAIRRVQVDMAEEAARDKYGDEKVEAAIAWAERLPQHERMQILQTRNPVREAIKRFDERQTLTEIGGDVAAYRAKVMDEALNDPAFMQKVADKLRGAPAVNGQRPVVNLPPSINRAAGSNAGHAEGTGSMSDADLYASAIR